MNKKVNTMLFILGATVFNILLTVLSFIVLLTLYARFLQPHLSEQAAGWAFPLVFIAAMAAAFLVYRKVIRFLTKKVDVDKYFDPIFGNRHRK